MFRFKILSLAIVLLAVGGVVFFLETTQLTRDIELLLSARVGAARAEADRVIDRVVNQYVDTAVEASQSAQVKQTLTSAKGLSSAQRAEHYAQQAGALREALKTWTERKGGLAPEWILVLDSAGVVVVHTEEEGTGDSLFNIPLVRVALSGAALDGVMELGGKVHLIAAATVMDGTEVSGAVLLGYPLDQDRVSGWGDLLPSLEDVSSIGLALLWNGRLLGANFQAPPGMQLPTTPSASEFGASELDLGPLPVLTPGLGQYLGVAVHSQGWPESLQLLVAVPHSVAFRVLAMRQLFIVAMTALLVLVAIFWGLSVRGAVTKPLSVIVEHLSGVQRGSNTGLLPEVALKEPYVRLGKLINMLIQSRTSAPRPAPTAKPDDISQVLGTAPRAETPTSTEEFNFAGIPGLEDGSGASQAPPEPSPPSVGGGKIEASPVPASESLPRGPQVEPPQGIASLFDEIAGDGEVATPLPGATSQPPSAVASTPPPAPATGVGGLFFDDDEDAPLPAPVQSSPPQAAPVGQSPFDPPSAASEGSHGSLSDPSPERTVMVQVPEELIAASAAATVPPPTADDAGFDDDANDRPESTVVAVIPPGLLDEVAEAAAEQDPDEAHFKDVYEQFIATRNECGEATADLTFDRFSKKLRRNREQLVSKYGCRTVRFQVYVKAGKAALKAVPVRD